MTRFNRSIERQSNKYIFGEHSLKNSISFMGISQRCNLCLEEKLSILKEEWVQKRSEIVSACLHKNRFPVSHLTKKGMQAIWTPKRPRFIFEHKNSSYVFRNLSTTWRFLLDETDCCAEVFEARCNFALSVWHWAFFCVSQTSQTFFSLLSNFFTWG